ncbi:hypothetical protein [Paucisalibacillus sp. EB02]|uniref:hypothetical protein n=1 Tax=Paucisalibacillus sp. EB02 TaxID=1347087 RepID=UPI0004B58C44|nr:hypothetical protein [Paucisalibacillus sp. EB02]
MSKDKLEKMLETMPQTNLTPEKKKQMLDSVMQHSGKSKGLYMIFFILLLLVNSYLYYLLYRNFAHFVPWHPHYIVDIIYVLLFFIAVIPVSAFLSEKLAIYAIKKGLGNGKYFKIFITVIIIVPILLFTFMIFNDYREKGLEDVIGFNTANVDYIIINDDVKTDKMEHAEALKDFLSQYRVKKMKDREWDGDVSNEKGFRITIYSNGKPISASIYENHLHYKNSGEYYKVLNGPIDMEWIEEFQQ